MDLSRRDEPTQPGVLTPGTVHTTISPEGAEEDLFVAGSLGLRRACETIILPPLQGDRRSFTDQGLKPLAKSSRPFGTMSVDSRSPFSQLTALTAMPALIKPLAIRRSSGCFSPGDRRLSWVRLCVLPILLTAIVPRGIHTAVRRTRRNPRFESIGSG